ncbi:MAG: ATP-binding protein [Deltaproteobacteria bacterium]|nr:ATP-binding protein [Deltaproteobacteria bacterium]
MAHTRKRAILPEFRKKLKAWPIVNLLGPRQCGKSTFLRELAFRDKTMTYETFDLLATRRRAENSPELFLKTVEVFPLVIDEVQKVPHIFDELKAIVDIKRIPGRYVLTGSMQFSRKIGIRESLTGRSATVRLDTMSILETRDASPISLADCQRYLARGGMPGVCFMREDSVRTNYWEQWLETICERDLRDFGQGRLSGDLARGILEACATLETPMIADIAKKLQVDSRRIQSHVQALRDLFVLREIAPHEAGVGKALLLPFDCGLAKTLGADSRRRWQVWFATEYLNQRAFRGLPLAPLKFYLTQRGSFIDFVTGTDFHLFCDSPFPSRRAKMTLDAAARKLSHASFKAYCPTEHDSVRLGLRQAAVPWAQTASIQE